MGPAPLLFGCGYIVGVALLRNNNHHHQVVNHYLGSQNIGGQLTYITHQHVSTIEDYVTKNSLQQYLRDQGLPQDKIVQAKKLKYVLQGKIEDISFIIQGSNFSSKLIVVTSKRVSQRMIHIKISTDQFTALYTAPQIKYNYTQGANYSSRSLDQNETNKLTDALKQRMNQHKLTN